MFYYTNKFIFKNYILKNFVSVAPSSGMVGKIILICTTAFNTLQLGEISKFFQLLVSEKMNFEQKRRFWTTVPRSLAPSIRIQL